MENAKSKEDVFAKYRLAVQQVEALGSYKIRTFDQGGVAEVQILRRGAIVYNADLPADIYG